VARRMAERRSETAVVTAGTGRPLGVVTSRSLCEQFAAGAQTINAFDAPRAVLPGLPLKSCFIEMVRGRCQSLVVTSDGSLESSVEGVLTDSDLALACGRNPTLVVRSVGDAENAADLAHARAAAFAMIAEGLTAPAVVPWFATFASEIDLIVLDRVVEWTLAEFPEAAPSNASWVFFGRSARGDLPAMSIPEFGIILPDAAPEPAALERWTHIAGQVEARLLACGYRPVTGPPLLRPDSRCRTLPAWKEFFAGCIQDPIGNAIFESRSLFDMRFALGNRQPLESLWSAIASGIQGNPDFLQVLANDTMGSLPPLTFYRDVVVDIDGNERSALDLDTAALRPLEDAARVFALARHDLAVTSTVERLEAGAQAMPVYRSVFREAPEAFRVVACHRILASLGRCEDSGLIYPSTLSRYEQTELKRTFQSIHGFLEFTEFNSDTLARL
jgi:CBS domain-containing protein